MTGTDIEVREEPTAQLAPIGDPKAFVAGYVAVADELARVVRSKRLATKISGREYVRVEGWTLLGSMLGVFPVCEWSRPVEKDGDRIGWEARVIARTKDGAMVGAAEAECLRTENTWRNRDDYALRSMAQTRATSKALRQPLGFVMTLAGLEATPAEEMPGPLDERETTTTDRTGDSRSSSDPYTLPFGKHKGVPLADVPRDYLEWVVGNTKDAGAAEACRVELEVRDAQEALVVDSQEDIPF